MNEQSLVRLRVAQRVVQAAGCRDDDVILLSGSAGAGYADRWSDVDVYVFVRRTPSPALRLAAPDASGLAYVSARRTARGGVVRRAIVHDLDVDVEFVSVGVIESTIDAVLVQRDLDPYKHKTLRGLLDATPLRGSDTWRDWCARLARYPDALAVDLIHRHLQLESLVALARRTLERGDVVAFSSRAARTLINCAALLGAVNRYYLGASPTTLKWLPRHLERMEECPADAGRRIALGLSDPSDATLADLDAMLRDVIALVERAFPEIDARPVREALRPRTPSGTGPRTVPETFAGAVGGLRRPASVVAIVATHDEERFVGGCIEHFARHGVGVYLIDNDSTDRTVEIARRFEGRGLVGEERLPRDDVFDLRRILERVEQLSRELDADWIMHADADERHGVPMPGTSLAEALASADRAGYNAVNFHEYTFTPTREEPDHDHAAFERTMRWYYPYLPRPLHRVNAWKRDVGAVNLRASAGHQARFPSRRVHPLSFPMRHYLFLSKEHAVRKYIGRSIHPQALADGWQLERSALRSEDVVLQAQALLRRFVSDDQLVGTQPLRQHPLFEASFWRVFLPDPDLRLPRAGSDWRASAR